MELLVRLGGGALSGSSINIFGTIWTSSRRNDLDKILDNLFRIDVADWASTWASGWGSRQR